jgi:hypothetical protein
MKMQSFNNPVRLENPDTGMEQTVETVRQAKSVLDGAWPAYHGSQHQHAEEVCDAALNGQSAPGEARRAFIAAAIEAHFHIH